MATIPIDHMTTPSTSDREKVNLSFRPNAALQRHFGAVLRVDGYGRRRLLINLEDLTGRAWFQARAHGIVSPLDLIAVPAGNGYLIVKNSADQMAGAFIGTVKVGGQTKHVQFTHQRLQAPRQQDGQQASVQTTFFLTASLGNLAPSNGSSYSFAKQWWSDLKSCVGNYGWPRFENDMNPFSPGIGSLSDAASSMSQASLGAAATWSVEWGLTVPLRSSIVRSGVSAAEGFGKASRLLSLFGVDVALADAAYAEYKGCL